MPYHISRGIKSAHHSLPLHLLFPSTLHHTTLPYIPSQSITLTRYHTIYHSTIFYFTLIDPSNMQDGVPYLSIVILFSPLWGHWQLAKQTNCSTRGICVTDHQVRIRKPTADVCCTLPVCPIITSVSIVQHLILVMVSMKPYYSKKVEMVKKAEVNVKTLDSSENVTYTSML